MKILKHWNNEDIDFLKENYTKLGREKCAKILNRTKGAIHRKCVRLKIKHTKKQVLQIQSESNKKHSGEFTVNEKLFMGQMNKITSYLLGFIWADGYLHIKKKRTGHINYRIIIGINKNDGKYIKKLLQTTGKWSICYTKNKNIGQDIMSFHCANTILGKFLFDNDYTKKSFKSADKILSKIPENLKHYWFRGFLDGDGCIHVPKNKRASQKAQIIFTGAYEQNWAFLSNFIKSTKVSFSYRKGKKKFNKLGSDRKFSRFSSISINGRINCLKLGDSIYKNYQIDKIGFKRKIKHFFQIIKDIKKMIKNPNPLNHYWNNPKPELLEIINSYSF